MEFQDDGVQMLQSLGFSELEATIYTFLLQESPATGYKIANAIGKPVANTYKGISTLQDKGAIIVDEGDNRLCRATPPAELFAQMQQGMRQQCERAKQALMHLGSPPEDERVYRLHTREQVLERARQMLARCQQVAVVSAFPQLLREITSELELAAERGVGVLLKVYHPVEIKGAHIALSNEADFLLHNFPAQELNLVTDAEEHLLSLLDSEAKTVIQAIWSGSAFLSFVQYGGLYNEWELTLLNRQIKTGTTLERLQETMRDRVFPLFETPGYKKLVAHLGRRYSDERK